jgi:hypothetical protein
MDKSQVVADFLFPTDKKTPCAVCPRVAAFDYPTPCALAGTTFGLNLALARNVQDVSQTPRERLRGLGTISFVQAKMLLASSNRLGTPHGHRPQRGTQQSDVVRVCAGDGYADRHAAGVGHDGSLDAKLTAIGGVFAGFFPRPTAPWSWSRPTLANAMRSRVVRHTFVDTFSRSDERLAVGSILESSDAPCLANRTAAATLSTDSPFATDRRFRWRRLADSREADRPSDCADTLATTARTAATFSPASAQTDRTNRNAYPPPCKEQVTSISCSTPVVAFCSVLG